MNDDNNHDDIELRNIVIKDSRIITRINNYYKNHDPENAEEAAKEISIVITSYLYGAVDNDTFDLLYKDVYTKVLKETKKRLLEKLIKQENE